MLHQSSRRIGSYTHVMPAVCVFQKINKILHSHILSGINTNDEITNQNEWEQGLDELNSTRFEGIIQLLIGINNSAQDPVSQAISTG